jgi:hypothetical protein
LRKIKIVEKGEEDRLKLDIKDKIIFEIFSTGVCTAKIKVQKWDDRN